MENQNKKPYKLEMEFGKMPDKMEEKIDEKPHKMEEIYAAYRGNVCQIKWKELN